MPKRKKWLEIDADLGIRKFIILEHALYTGEMRNHENLKANVDTNKSVLMKTMSVIGYNYLG